MEVPYNQTSTNVSDFQHNGINRTQNFNLPPFSAIIQCLNIKMAFCWVIFFIAFPGICFALYKLCSQVRPDQVAPVYVTNLLISDLIQVCTNSIASTLVLVSLQGHNYAREALVLLFIYIYSLQVNIFFMMCISAERYIMIAHVVWYRNIQTRRTSVMVSVLMWILPAVPFILAFIFNNNHVFTSVLLLPYPLVMFFFVATWRALSRTSVPRNDQIRIRSILALILLIYTILFLPNIVRMNVFGVHTMHMMHVIHLALISDILLALNPLFDLLLYVLLRKDVKEVLRDLFCFKKEAEDNTN